MKKIIYLLPLVAILVATGCKKSQFNINKNINSPTDSTITYDVILPAALHASGSIVATQWGSIQNWMGYWARSGTYAPNVTEETYQITTGFGNGVWNNCYDNNYDYQIIAQKAAVAGAGFYEGISRIMKAHNFQILVDVYGNVPYDEALKGSANPTPAYAKGLDIYKKLFREIDAGIALIKAAGTTGVNKDIAKNDIMFGANKTLWAKFGNTLKLRMLIHAYAVAGIDKTAELAIIAAEGSGYLDAGQNAQIQPGYASDKPNPFYNTYKNTTTNVQTANNVYYRANEWGIDYYAYNGDKRQARFYEAGTGGMVGVAYGLPPVNENASAVLAGIGPGLYKANTAPQLVMSSSESFFLQAEARQRGFITTGPTVASLVRSGIVESFTYIGVPNPVVEADAYITGNASYPDVDINGIAQVANGPVGGIFTILSQKWFALNGIATLEVWTDYRRVPYNSVSAQAGANAEHFVYGAGVGYPAGPPISVSPQNTSTRIPLRFLYPQTEYNYNLGNVSAEGTINAFTSRIFWDLN